ncbi:MAG: OFA family MFS transporter [Candidatus Odinarchaeota archaeon]
MERTEPLYNRYLVVVGALVIQLCLGSIYAWSIFQTSLKTVPYNWGVFESLLPFATGLATFAVTMVLAGRWQDKAGPQIVATTGGVLLGMGYILATGIIFFQSDPTVGLLWVMITYGIIGGAGIGLAYVCPIAALVKWFPDKKGLITGIAVAGFGAGALIFAQVETFFIEMTANNDISLAFLACGIIYLIFVVLGAQLLRNPPTGWKPRGWEPAPPKTTGIGRDCTWREMIRTPQFYLLWLMFSLAATAGLMTLGILKSFLQAANPLVNAVMAATIVGIVAIFNAAGRIFWGAISDKLGRTLTLLCMFALLTLAMLVFGFQTDILLLTAVAAIIGLCFGGNFALFPSTTADYFGTKNVGNNYGIVFTAYGVAGVLGALIPTLFLQSIVNPTGSDYAPAFLLCAIFAIIAAILAIVSEWINRRI